MTDECSVADCHSDAKNLGWCSKHYQKLRPVPECTVGDCTKRSKALGLCAGHYSRKLKGAEIEAPMRTKVNVSLAGDGKNKTCTGTCGLSKPLEEFYQQGSGVFSSFCRSCFREYKKVLRGTDKYKEYEKEYNQRTEVKRASCEKVKRQYWNQPPEKRTAYYFNNKESISKRIVQDRALNPEKYAKRNKRWRQENPEKASEYGNRRRAKKKELLDDGNVSRDTLRSIYGDTCPVCHRTMEFNIKECLSSQYATVEHLVSIDCNGENTLENCVLWCKGCNSSKRNRNLLQFMLWRVEAYKDDYYRV